MTIYIFTYKTINKINNKYYIGVHSTNDIEDGYLGSGIALKRAIRKHGTHNFKREIISFYETTQEAFTAEQNIVNEYIVQDKNSYNMCLGGNGYVGKLIPNKITRKNMSDSQKERYRLNGNPNKGKLHGPRNLETKKRQAEKFRRTFKERSHLHKNMKGIKRSEETKNKLSNAAYNWPRSTCEYCGTTTTNQAISRYHGKSCIKNKILKQEVCD